MTADRSANLAEFAPSPSPTPSPVPPNFAITRTGVSEHTFANGHNFNSYYYGDTLGNFYFGFDLVGTPAVDTVFTAAIPAVVNTPGGVGGFFIGNPTPGDCMDAQAIVTGIAVKPVSPISANLITRCAELPVKSYTFLHLRQLDVLSTPLRKKFAPGFSPSLYLKLGARNFLLAKCVRLHARPGGEYGRTRGR